MRIVFFVVGCIFAIVGGIGIIIPVLPTTPFLIIASLCFLRSSKKAYQYLYNNTYFGPYLAHYHTKQGISSKEKWKAYLFLWTSMLISISFTSTLSMKMLLLTILLCVTIHILKIKTKVN